MSNVPTFAFFIPIWLFLLVAVYGKLRDIHKLLVKVTTPPRLIVPDDLDLTTVKPNPIIRVSSAKRYQPGDRVRATNRAGFHVGAVGTVVFQEPNGERCWVERDGSSSPVFYYNHELEKEYPEC